MIAALAGLSLGVQANAKETATAGTAEKTIMGECHGVNSCKGTGMCGGQNHSCGGANSCKGQGWLSMTQKDCLDKKGQWKKMSNMMHQPPGNATTGTTTETSKKSK